MPSNKVGLNLQTLPPRMKPYVKADPGFMVFNCDMSQAEYRKVAHFAPEPGMLAALDAGVDAHANTYSRMFNIPVEAVSDEAASSDIGDGTKSQRFWGKMCNHALNYDLGPNGFADRFEVPVAQAKILITKYHNAFPGVRYSYHKKIQKLINNGRTLVNPFGRSRTFLGRIDKALYREAYAHIPSSTTADHVNRTATIPVYYHEEFRGLQLMFQVHDSVVFQVPVSLGFEVIAYKLLRLKASMETPIPASDWSEEFIVPADCEGGLNYGKKGLKSINLSKAKTIDNVATQLEEIYSRES